MKKKKEYTKPQVNEVKLTPGDAVLTACKKGPHMAGPENPADCNAAVCAKSANLS